jgi:hypothetical protein
MPQRWENIEDTATIATPVWLSRRANVDAATSTTDAAAAVAGLWKPLWKSDCQRLNEFRPSSSTSSYPSDNHHTLHLECGRKTANLQNYTIRSNFCPRAPIESLCSAIWFERRGDEKKKDITLVPIMDEYDTLQMETLYQKAVTATGTLGSGLTTASLDERPVLKDGVTKVRLFKTSGGDNALSLRLIPPGNWLFTSEVVLQRGYGNYVASGGEDIEMSLGPVQHVMFVVHGIGEALFSRQDIQVMGLMEQTQQARMEIQQRQYDRYQQDLVKYQKKYQGNTKNSNGTTAPPPPAPPNRIELIPIEWFDTVHDDSNDLMKSLRATTLPTIPALRAIANDVVFDILMYLTPAFCRQVLETVTDQICLMYETFRTIHPQFGGAGSTITLAGHSLGSVICWDLLAVLKDHLATTTSRSSGEGGGTTTLHGASAFATGGWGPPVTVAKHLPFQPDQTIFLGSPLGMFLTLRGAHPALAGLRENNNYDSIVSSFTLPTKSLYNIFHPR